MKKLMISLAVILLTGFSMTAVAQEGPAAQGQMPPRPTLEGLWQLCTVSSQDGHFEMHLQPYLKLMSADGSFYSVLIRTTEGGSAITGQGTFKKLSDSTYVENVDKSLYPNMNNSDNVITYHLQGPDWMILDFKVPNNPTVMHEIWMRIHKLSGQGQGQGQRQDQNQNQGMQRQGQFPRQRQGQMQRQGQFPRQRQGQGQNQNQNEDNGGQTQDVFGDD